MTGRKRLIAINAFYIVVADGNLFHMVHKIYLFTELFFRNCSGVHAKGRPISFFWNRYRYLQSIIGR